MTRAVILTILSLAASSAGFSLDRTINNATARELVLDALASLGENGAGTKIAIYPIPDYWAPDFITLEADVPYPEKIQPRYFAVNPWTGDIWDTNACTRITSPTIKRKQEAIWKSTKKSAKLPEEARHVLQARSPACTPANPERSPEKK
jgi:hypothetical protein